MARVSGKAYTRMTLKGCTTLTCGLKREPVHVGIRMVQCKDLREELLHCGCMGSYALSSGAF